MKLRIKGDSLRLRLTRTEVERLGGFGIVEDRIDFGGNRSLLYRLRLDTDADELKASFVEGAIELRLPAAAGRQWCASDEVGLTGLQSNGGAGLRLLVEKDFACLKPRAGEDESDQFANPQAR